MMIKEAIIRLSQKQDLSYDEAEQVMNEIMEGKAKDYLSKRMGRQTMRSIRLFSFMAVESKRRVLVEIMKGQTLKLFSSRRR